MREGEEARRMVEEKLGLPSLSSSSSSESASSEEASSLESEELKRARSILEGY